MEIAKVRDTSGSTARPNFSAYRRRSGVSAVLRVVIGGID